MGVHHQWKKETLESTQWLDQHTAQPNGQPVIFVAFIPNCLITDYLSNSNVCGGNACSQEIYSETASYPLISCLNWLLKVTTKYRFWLLWIQSLVLSHGKVSLPYKFPGTQFNSHHDSGFLVCPSRSFPCILCCHSLKHLFPPYEKMEKAKSVVGGPFAICAEPCSCWKERKQTSVTTELGCHYLATIDHSSTFFLCFLHCSKKHAHWLFGVEWPIEDISCREKGMCVISPQKASLLLENLSQWTAPPLQTASQCRQGVSKLFW